MSKQNESKGYVKSERQMLGTETISIPFLMFELI
ncbi:hypothetical protein Halhy_2764 [Haliscomenobacter hydrossis DSM 1100]|uniref:Uncharacterized protein n=1 Tax=Haliscomenobacter hydrossis (strain ATCC 27775 / DSM 1100 / LMG 10767 / O) TaxID=760192 RepID=F4L1Z9_HALH1|nr:hypothetical protein Halhy_2764 [Haliscomenobacter hydrossis DSM 1100]